MGRQPKKGLDYFPKDVNYYDDFKIIDLLSEYGPLGQTVYDVVLTMIYRQGYYLEVPSIEKFSLVVMRTIGSRWIKKEAVSQVILYCADIGLFDNALLSQNVITSVGIQRRYSEVTARNKVDKEKYWLLENEQLWESVTEKSISVTKKPISVTEKPINDAEMQQIKVNKNKEKESKENKSIYQQIADMYNETCISFPRLTILSEKRKQAIKARLNTGYKVDDFKTLFEEAEKSSFLKGKNNKNWQATFDWLISDSNMAKVLDGNYRDRDKPTESNPYDFVKEKITVL